MKIEQTLRLLCLLAVLGTAGRQPWASAADTLRAESQRVVNTCLDAPSALVTVELGEVLAADSLMLFDITLTYDFTKIVFTDLLIQGTLSEQITGIGRPILNTSIPGEARVSGFTISTPIKGNKPLFAVRGVPAADCRDSIEIGLAFVEFNPEFKRTVDVWRGDTIDVRTIARPVESISASFRTTTDTTRGLDSTVSVELIIEHASVPMTPIHVLISSSGVHTIDTVIAATDHTVIEEQTGDGNTRSMIIAPSSDSEPFVLSVLYRSTSQDTAVTESVVTLSISDSCTCLIPENGNPERWCSIVNAPRPVVSVLETVNEGSVSIRLVQGALIAQCVHGQPETMVVLDLLGREFGVPVMPSIRGLEVSAASLPIGPMMVIARCGSSESVMMTLKER
jgi:hypothetical protein